MQAIVSKRIKSYIIDIIILGFFLFVIGATVPNNNNLKALNIELDTLNEQFLKEEVSTKEYINHYSEIMYQMDKENIIYTIVNIVFIIIYFIIMPYFLNKQTIGQKLYQIRVDKNGNEVSINDLIIRNVIINGLGYLLISLLLIYTLPALSYFIIMICLSIVQLIVIIITLIGLIKNNHNLILHDRLTNTEVINL